MKKIIISYSGTELDKSVINPTHPVVYNDPAEVLAMFQAKATEAFKFGKESFHVFGYHFYTFNFYRPIPAEKLRQITVRRKIQSLDPLKAITGPDGQSYRFKLPKVELLDDWFERNLEEHFGDINND